MSKMYNPSLRREPRYEPASVIPLNQDNSILEWLKNSGRLIARDEKEDPEELLPDDGLDGIMGDEGFDEDDDYGGIAEEEDDMADDDGI